MRKPEFPVLENTIRRPAPDRSRRPSCPVFRPVFLLGILIWTLASVSPVRAEHFEVDALVREALRTNPELLAAHARIATNRHKIPQVKSLPDPMFTVGYQNEGFDDYNYGLGQDNKYMFSVSQGLPFPGKLGLKGEMAARETENTAILLRALRLKTATRVREVCIELALAHKNLDLLADRRRLFSRMEGAALARYAAGVGSQGEAAMAQTEKYMLLEREEMQLQRIRALGAMLDAALGRKTPSEFGRPPGLAPTPFVQTVEQAVETALKRSPDVHSREKMIEAAQVKVDMAQREYYPDFNVGAIYEKRDAPVRDSASLKDMWSASVGFTVPIYFGSKQDNGVLEAKSGMTEAEHELAGIRNMIAASVRENHAMLKSAERLLAVYRNEIIPKAYQDYDLALANYASGKAESLPVISSLKAYLEAETLYWAQLAEREKALARLQALMGEADPEPPAAVVVEK